MPERQHEPTAASPRKYVEEVEYPEMVFGPDGFWLTCGDCGWDGPVRATRQEAKRDRWRHPDWFCSLHALWIDYVSPRYGRRWRRV